MHSHAHRWYKHLASAEKVKYGFCLQSIARKPGLTGNFGVFYSIHFRLNGLMEHGPFAALGYALSAANFLAFSGNFRFFGVTVSQLLGTKIRPAAILTRWQQFESPGYELTFNN